MNDNCHKYHKINCAKCGRAAFVLVDGGLSVRHQHGGEKHETILTINQLNVLLIEQGYVILPINQIAAKLAA